MYYSYSLLSLLFILFLSLLIPSSISLSLPSLPLSTTSRWIIDAGGRRTKMACVNWAAHLDPAAAEGLNKQPVDHIAEEIADAGFNCVRLTWAVYMVTNQSFESVTLRESLERIGLSDAVEGVERNNPDLVDLTLVRVYQEVVAALARNNLMVILDNQLSKPGWCCSKLDGNGFFGDVYFDTDEWLKGLKTMAIMFNNTPNVVGMSLRNELRGPKQNFSLWYRYMQEGAELVHSSNPNLLVILSGLDYDKDLFFLSLKQVNLSFSSKLVFELHWYGFSDGGDWENQNLNKVCNSVLKSNIFPKGGFLLKQGFPLFFSEFGFDQSGTHKSDNRYLSCFLSLASELDFDWALWALQGSYYLREGERDYDESYGLLSFNWEGVRNPNFVQRISALQNPFQGPGLSNDELAYNLIFHPLSGLCLLSDFSTKLVKLGSCFDSKAWNYTYDIKLVIKGTDYCLQAVGIGKNVKIGTDCEKRNSKWNLLSDSKMHVSTKLSKIGRNLCLDVGNEGSLITNECKCLHINVSCSPEIQWFKIILSNREIVERSWFERIISVVKKALAL